MTSNVIPFRRKRPPHYAALLVVICLVAASLALLIVNFRVGAVALALSVGVAGVLRAGLPDDHAGLLVVRTSRIDLSVLVTLFIALIVLALIVPNPV